MSSREKCAIIATSKRRYMPPYERKPPRHNYKETAEMVARGFERFWEKRGNLIPGSMRDELATDQASVQARRKLAGANRGELV